MVVVKYNSEMVIKSRSEGLIPFLQIKNRGKPGVVLRFLLTIFFVNFTKLQN